MGRTITALAVLAALALAASAGATKPGGGDQAGARVFADRAEDLAPWLA